MKRTDVVFAFCVFLFLLPFLAFDDVFQFYINFNGEHGIVTSYIKFAILGTLGEVIGLRIRTGSYYKKGFGVFPRAFVWGFIGLTIKFAFIVFCAGVPAFMEYAGLLCKPDATSLGILCRIWKAFAISVAINVTYAPVLMTFHRITDMHIIDNGGSLRCLFKKIEVFEMVKNADWTVHWDFVLKKTIPLFWIPAQTITFLLPQEYRVLFAAALGVLLGVILAIANLRGAGQKQR